MRKYLTFSLLFYFSYSVDGQAIKFCIGDNLFPNPSFEEYTVNCPDSYSGFFTGDCKDWDYAGGSPDYYNCTFWGGANSGLGTIGGLPSDGNGFAGIWSLPTNLYCNGKLQSEPIRAILKDTLIPNEKYIVSFDVRIEQSGNPLDSTGNPCVDFGMIFYKGSIPKLVDGCGCFSKTPQIRISNDDIPYRKYKHFTFTYIPDDYYTKVIIGPMCNPNMGIGPCATPLDNFGPFSNYLNIDNLSLTNAPCIFLNDSSICQHACLDSLIFSRIDTNLHWELINKDISINGNGLINNDICFTEPGYYDLKITDSGIHTFVLPDLIHVWPAPELNFGNDTILCKGEAITLHGGDSKYAYLWNEGTTGNTLTISEEGTYFLQKTLGECTSSDTLLVSLLDCDSCVQFPNVFTPNHDMINDLLYPFIFCPDRINVIVIEIFNRWGQKIYTGKNAWNGEDQSGPVPADLYIWKVIYDEYTQNKQTTNTRVGEITLLR